MASSELPSLPAIKSTASVTAGDSTQTPTALSTSFQISPRALEEALSSASSERVSPTDDLPTWPKETKAWLALLGCFFLMFNSWGLVNAYGTFQSYYMQHLLPGRDILFLNLVGSTESFVVLALSFIVGRLLDAGYYAYLTCTGWVLVTVGMFTLSVVNGNGGAGQGNYTLIWVTQGLTTGLGMACMFVSSSQIAATWFIKRKSTAVGIVASGASISGLIYPVMTKLLITKIGFNKAVQCVAGLVCLTAFASFVLARPNPKHQFRKPERWTDTRFWIDTHAFRNQSFCWFSAAIAFMFFGFYAVFFNLEEWAAVKGFGYKDKVPSSIADVVLDGKVEEVPDDAIRTFYLLSIMNASSTIGRISSAYLCDHFGALNVHCVVTILSSLLVLILWSLASAVSTAIAFVVLFGIVSGAVIGLPPASMANILGPCSTAQTKLGQWTGMMYTAAAPFALTGPVIAGHLISEFDSYLTVQMWSGTCLLLSAACMAGAIWSRLSAARREELGVGRIRKTWSSAVSTVVGREPDEDGGDDDEKTLGGGQDPSLADGEKWKGKTGTMLLGSRTPQRWRALQGS